MTDFNNSVIDHAITLMTQRANSLREHKSDDIAAGIEIAIAILKSLIA